jgi:alkylhydroperoxidase/carboxymuconolactone decarboxylase family protein YurZ
MADNVPEVFAGYQRMHHGALAADPRATKLAELALVALNAGELQTRFVAIHAATARRADATDAELLEAVICAIPVRGVAAWAAGAEGLFVSP